MGRVGKLEIDLQKAREAISLGLVAIQRYMPLFDVSKKEMVRRLEEMIASIDAEFEKPESKEFNPQLDRVMRQMMFCPVCSRVMDDVDFDEKPESLKKRCPKDHATIAWGWDNNGDWMMVIVTDDIAILT